MNSVKFIIMLSVLILVQSIKANFIQPYGTISMELRDSPALKQVVDLIVAVNSQIDAKECQIEVLFPLGIIPVNKTTKWVRDLSKGVPVE